MGAHTNTTTASVSEPELRERVRSHAASVRGRYDWSVVTDQVLTVYEMVLGSGGGLDGVDPAAGRVLPEAEA